LYVQVVTFESWSVRTVRFPTASYASVTDAPRGSVVTTRRPSVS
jgi:hypothetical protein